MNYLKSFNIITQVHYIPITMHPYYKNNKFHSNDNKSFEYYGEALSLPLFYDMDIDDIDYILKRIDEFIELKKFN